MSEPPEKPTIWDELNDFCWKLTLASFVLMYVTVLGVMLGSSILLFYRL